MGRRIVQHRTWRAVCRRTTRRHYLFTPDDAGHVENAFWYCLALAAERTGVRVAAAILMSTHWHLVVQDVAGQMPRFYQELGRNFAQFIKVFRGWPEEVLNKSGPEEQEILGPGGMLHALSYALANATDAGAVRYARDWPGALTRPEDLGRRVIRARRPYVYFRPDNDGWPEHVALELTMPESLEDAYGLEGARELVAHRVHAREQAAWQKLEADGRGFAGIRRTLRRQHTERANSYETFGALKPRFIAGGDARAAAEALARFRQWNADYDRALAQWCAGNRRAAVFPYGTWWMRVHHGARCHPPPAN